MCKKFGCAVSFCIRSNEGTDACRDKMRLFQECIDEKMDQLLKEKYV